MKNTSPLRQKFIDHLTLRQLSARTVKTYIEWVADLARFHRRSPDSLGRPEIDSWLLHLIQQRKLSDASVTLAINSLRSFYGGQNLMDHPHLHCLVTGGGLQTTSDGSHRWVGPTQSRYLFPVQAVAAMFAGKFLHGLEDLRRRGKLVFEGALAEWTAHSVWQSRMQTLRSVRWIVFAKGSVTGPEAVLEYLGRYTHRVAIANHRITSLTNSTVSFRYKDYRDGSKTKTMTLTGVEFLHRLALHLLPEGFTKIRHYGLLGNNRRKRMIPLARDALKGSRWQVALVPKQPSPALPVDDAGCPRCGAAELQCIGRLDAQGRFTPLAEGARQARIQIGEPPIVGDTS